MLIQFILNKTKLLMPEKNKNERKLSLTTGQLTDQIQLLLGRVPNELEFEIFESCFNNESVCASIINEFIKQHPNPEFIELTPEISGILRTESFELDESSDNTVSSKLIIRLINKTLKKFARPVVFMNSYIFETIKPKAAKAILNNIINGTSLVSNTIGIPTFQVETTFTINNRNITRINGLSLGILEKKSELQSQTKLKNGDKIFMLGKTKPKGTKSLKNENNLLLSASCLKRVHDAIIALLQENSILKIEPVDKNGIFSSLLKLVKNEEKGLNINISNLKLNLKETNDNSWIKSFYENNIILVSNQEETLIKIASDWEIDCIELGEIIPDYQLIIRNKKAELAKIPIDVLHKEHAESNIAYSEVEETEKRDKINLKQIPLPKKLREVAWFLIKHPNIASKQCIFEQYDSTVGTANMSSNFPTAAKIYNLKGTNKAMALGVSNNSMLIDAYPEIGIKMGVANLAQQMASSGASPKGITLSITSSRCCDTSTYSKLAKMLRGLDTIAKKYRLSYSIENFEHEGQNETKGQEKLLNAHLAMLGLIENKNHQMTLSFKNKGNIIFLIGQSKEDFSNSEYLNTYLKIDKKYQPDFDLEMEYKTQIAMQELISKNYICSANNISKGGLFISLVESAMVHGFGFDIITDTDIRTDAFLFAESPGRMLVSITPNKEDKFIDFMIKKEIPFLALGHVTKGEMRVDDISFGFIEDAKTADESSFKELINS